MPHTQRVFDALEKNIPWFKKRAGEPKSLLYIGWRHDCKPWWHDTFCPALGIERVGVLEIFPPNHARLEQEIWSGRYKAEAILGDARKIYKHVKPGEWDVIFWDHGPEHVTWEDLQQCTPILREFAGRLLLYVCPWGEWPQGAEDGNQMEIHRNYVTKEQFLQLGLDTVTFGEPGQRGEGELVGFNLVKEFSFDASMGW